jgi:hypothetical protein
LFFISIEKCHQKGRISWLPKASLDLGPTDKSAGSGSRVVGGSLLEI